MVPPDVVLALRDAFDRSDVDDIWSVWSKNAEEGLFRAYCRAGGPTAADAGRPYRVSQGDEVDAASAQFFVNS